MNHQRPQIRSLSLIFRVWLSLRRLLPKQRCRAFGGQGAENKGIDRIYVINLDREPGRWSNMRKELRCILDSSGAELLSMTKRHVAIDSNAFSDEPSKDADVDPFYTLGDQLFVEPQPLVFPTTLELTAPIRMSRAEVAVARSHIKAWRNVFASSHAYVLILEDDVWFRPRFSQHFGQVWEEVTAESDTTGRFDILYLSYLEARHGAPKIHLSENTFRPKRGLWHLAGYVLSREGAQKLLRFLPCRGPVDLWINQQFEALNVQASKRPLISQRRDASSSNSYSILPTLTSIGAITSEGASLFNVRPTHQPVFAFGPEGSGHSSLAMALCMLGYRCCSDFQELPEVELERLLEGKRDKVFNAYVNIGILGANIPALRRRYPRAKYIITSTKGVTEDEAFARIEGSLKGADVVVLPSGAPNKWQIVCEHLRCAPPICSFPQLKDLGQRRILEGTVEANQLSECQTPRRDESPWVVEPRTWWQGIRTSPIEDGQLAAGTPVRVNDSLRYLDTRRWLLRTDTFTDNLALFRSSNFKLRPGIGAALFVRNEPLGARDYSAASICSRDQFLYGTFEATIRASNVPGVVTGFFLHRNSPRQEIDVEIAGNRPDRLVVNVFYNPGGEGANFDYGYRGAPRYIDLGFDASEASHRYEIEWSPCEILWRVDDRLVHRRVIWDPTPIPHLPMALHVNSWPSRSTQLAGRINSRRLPATTIVESIALETRCAVSSAGPDDLRQTDSESLPESQRPQ